jgi:hypothetical protein
VYCTVVILCLKVKNVFLCLNETFTVGPVAEQVAEQNSKDCSCIIETDALEVLVEF